MTNFPYLPIAWYTLLTRSVIPSVTFPSTFIIYEHSYSISLHFKISEWIAFLGGLVLELEKKETV